MARSKAPRKRKPGKSGKPPVARITPPSYPKRFMVSFPPDTDGHEPDEFFYDTPAEAIQHCVRLGPQFFLDTQAVTEYIVGKAPTHALHVHTTLTDSPLESASSY
ncbi:hypothetical protein ACQFN5_06150 [Klebsiella sp. WOUb02]